MAGILFIVAVGLVDMAAIKHIFKSTNSERAIFSVTFLAALFLDLEFAILAGILLSLMLYLMRASRPRIVTRVPDPNLPNRKFTSDMGGLKECPQLHIMRIDGSLFFGSVAYLRERLSRLEQQHPEQKHLAIIAQGISFVDIAAADVLANEATRRREIGGGLYLINPKQGLWDSLEECHAIAEDKICAKNVFQGKSAALTGIFQKMDKDICSGCRARIFTECATVEFVEKPRTAINTDQADETEAEISVGKAIPGHA
jgi:SulP family sulfate permease